jgi:hypothetical protein
VSTPSEIREIRNQTQIQVFLFGEFRAKQFRLRRGVFDNRRAGLGRCGGRILEF